MIALAGIVLAWCAIFGGVLLAGGQIGSLTHYSSAFIVLGGTFAAGMIHADAKLWRLAWRLFPTIFWSNRIDPEQCVVKLVRWSQIVRRNGPLTMDAESNAEQDDYLRLGLQLVADGVDKTQLIKNLQVVTESRETESLRVAEFFEALGRYAPALGLIAAASGLIQALTQSSDLSAVSAGLAMALAASIYGVALASLFCIPVAGRLRTQALWRSQFEELVLDGFISILEGENPRALERRLQEYRL